jgi:hypothetical protein
MASPVVHKVINNLWTDDGPQPVDRCDYGGRCPGRVTMILAMAATGTDGPATAERRPMCESHGQAVLLVDGREMEMFRVKDPIAKGRAETDACERGTPGCPVLHLSDTECETW